MNVDFATLEEAFAIGDRAAICQALAARFSDDSEFDQLEGLVGFVLDGGRPPVAESSTAQIFVDNMQMLQREFQTVGEPANRAAKSFHRHIGTELDFLGDVDGADNWSLVQCLNYLMLGRIKPTRNAAVVGTMRDDGIYILEWVAHYRSLGFDHLFIYTNDNDDGSETLLRLLAGHGVITLIESETVGNVRPERKAFEHALHLLRDLREYRWVLFVDSDEYLEPASRYDHSIANVLADLDARFPDRLPSAVCYEWLWYVSGMIFERQPRLLLERFQYATPHALTKSLVLVKDVLSMRQEHFPEVKSGGFLVDSEFVPFPDNSLWGKESTQYGGGCVKHYWARSFEEFSVKKARGASLNLEDNEYDRDFELFFTWNSAELPELYLPPDAALMARVKQEVDKLRQLQGVDRAVQHIEACYPALLRRYDNVGGLRKLYRDTWERVRRKK